MQSPAWYLNRLRTMSAAEVLHRIGRKASRTLQRSIGTRSNAPTARAIDGFVWAPGGPPDLAKSNATLYIAAADSNKAGLWLELDAILATVIGGTALTGERFYPLGSIVGAILIQTLTTSILTRGIPVEYTLVVKAVVIFAVCLLQSEEFRKMIWRRRVAA